MKAPAIASRSAAAAGASAEGLDVEVVAAETATPAQVLLNTLRNMGCTLTHREDPFTVSPAVALDDDLRAAIRKHRWEILALLEDRAAA